eukprot:401115-Prorocentrum_minimum.AAC.2
MRDVLACSSWSSTQRPTRYFPRSTLSRARLLEHLKEYALHRLVGRHGGGGGVHVVRVQVRGPHKRRLLNRHEQCG